MESLFYEVYDSYQVDSKAAGAGGCIDVTADTADKCKFTSEVQHKSLGTSKASETHETCKAKLLSFLETDCVPVSQQAFPTTIAFMLPNVWDPWWLVSKPAR